MTVFTTPTGEPFFCGTYFPPRPVQGMPSFTAGAGERRGGVDDAPGRGGGERRDHRGGARPSGRRRARSRSPAADVVDRALAGLATTFDAARGGFGGAPEVPAVDGAGVAAAPPRAHRGRARRSRWPRRRSTRWPAAGCTTSWPAASPGTRWTPRGWCRTSRRCSTTTRSCCGCTLHRGGRRARRWRGGSRRRRRSGCSTSCARAEGGFASSLDADSEGARARSTSGAPRSCGRCSGTTTAPGRPTSSA